MSSGAILDQIKGINKTIDELNKKTEKIIQAIISGNDALNKCADIIRTNDATNSNMKASTSCLNNISGDKANEFRSKNMQIEEYINTFFSSLESANTSISSALAELMKKKNEYQAKIDMYNAELNRLQIEYEEALEREEREREEEAKKNLLDSIEGGKK